MALILTMIRNDVFWTYFYEIIVMLLVVESRNNIAVLSVIALTVFTQFVMTDPDNFDETVKNTCLLDRGTFYPWLIRIWDDELKTTVGHGTLISYLVVLSTCSNFHSVQTAEDIKRHKLIGKTLKNRNYPQHWCFQVRFAEKLYRHPKCSASGSTAHFFFDYAVWVLWRPFAAASVPQSFVPGQPFPYPELEFPESTMHLMRFIRLTKVDANLKSCELPSFRAKRATQGLLTSEDVAISIIRSSRFCSQIICASQSSSKTTKCIEKNGDWGNFNFLCTYSNTSSGMSYQGTPELSWYAGAPLVCNGTGYGIASLQRKSCLDALGIDCVDFNVVLTFLRGWRWLHVMRRQFSALQKYIEQTSSNPMDSESYRTVEKDVHAKSDNGRSLVFSLTDLLFLSVVVLLN